MSKKNPWKALSLKEAMAFNLEEASPDDLAGLLHRCRKEKHREYGLLLHAFLCESGLDSHKALGNHLISMLVEITSVSDARKVFDNQVFRNEWSWYVLIKGYIECGMPHHAFKLYSRMIHDNVGVCPGGHTHVALLKACGRSKDIERGIQIHAYIARQGFLEKDAFLGSTLVDMYAKCGSFEKAEEVFGNLNLHVRNIVSWNAMMTAYAKHGQFNKVINCFEEMKCHGILPDAVACVCCLKACATLQDIQRGHEIYGEVQRRGLLDIDVFLGSSLVYMYAKCGSITEAQQVFDGLPLKNVVTWNSLLTAYANCENHQQVLNHYHKMQLEKVSPDVVTYVLCLKACGSIDSLEKIEEIHAHIVKQGLFHRDTAICNTLIDVYAKCGCLFKAKKMFDSIPHPDATSWTSLIAGCVQHRQENLALECFEKMQLVGTSPNEAAFSCILQACASLGAIDKGEEVHVEVERQGLLEHNLFVGSALIDMYAKCGFLSKAKEVFEKYQIRDVVLWNTLILGYAEHGHGEEALRFFKQMQTEGFFPSSVTFISIMKACSNVGAIDKCRYIHAEIEEIGLLKKDLIIGSTLIDMYAKCSLLAKAQEVFDKLPAQNVVTWNTLITGYTQHGYGDIALKCLALMKSEGIYPDAFTFSCCLKASCMISTSNMGEALHDELNRKGLVESDLVVGNTLINMYTNSGFLGSAQEVFDQLPVCDVITWNGLISGYSEHGYGEEALRYFEQMRLKGHCANTITYTCSLRACGNIGASRKGLEIHVEIVKKGMVERETIGNNLIDMYAKCGLLPSAENIFDSLSVQDVASWNSLVAGYSQLGQTEKVIGFFKRMVSDGINPDHITFLILLNACSRTGLFNMSQTYFEAMNEHYGIIPSLKHHTCVVDLLGRVGQLEMAIGMIKKIPFYPNLAVWHMVLDACRNGGNLELGKQAFEHAVCLDENDAGAYVLMTQIYSGG